MPVLIAPNANSATQDVTIRNGLFFDGTGKPGALVDLAIKAGKVAEIGPRLAATGLREIDARGCWVMPGMLDIHTHYDAEIEAIPGLDESVRHGVTTVVMGNCSLSAAIGSCRDVLDLFCRVESLPREVLMQFLGDELPWKNVRQYYDHLETLPIGPNVSSFIGHSSVRAHVMGMERSLKEAKATPEEIRKMQGIVSEAMDEGYLGLSIDLLPWHRMDGDLFRGISVPSQHAAPSEYGKLASVVRERDRVLQATPNALNKKTVLTIAMLSTGVLRKPLRTTIVAAMDVKTNRLVYKVATIGATMMNGLFRSNIRWQSLAEPFLNYCDGVFTPLFEEFPTGVAAISATADERRQMFRDAKYRAAFRADWESSRERLFHRNLDDMWIIASPIASHVGKSFQQVAQEAGVEPIVYFMDLMAEYDTAVRWKTVVTNDRPDKRRFLFAHSTTLPGFNDSGAHARNMAFQDGGLQMLQQVVLNPDVMPIEKAIHKLTGLSAEWLGLDTGTLLPGKHADVAVIDPEKLKTGLSEPLEVNDPRFHGAMRMVKRSDGVVRHVLVGGKVAFEDGAFADDFGQTKYGRLLRSTR